MSIDIPGYDRWKLATPPEYEEEQMADNYGDEMFDAEVMIKWPGGCITEKVWYEQSGTTHKCCGCGMEDHTGDVEWDRHICIKTTPAHDFNNDEDIPF